MRQRINRTPLQSEIIKYIQEYIHDENLKAGDKLPSQSELMEMMGVSRTSLREAIKTLEAKEVLEVKNGKGIYVKHNDENVLMSQLNFLEEKESLLEVMEARRILEKEIIKLVVKNITDKELESLGEVVKVLMDKYHRGEKQNVEDKKFHYMIYESSHNRVMHRLILSISRSMDKLWDFPLNMKDPFTDTIPLHEELYKAICERDVKRALEINEHILGMMYQTIQKQK
ncbi:FadR/GntR family transcriptional regulator [Anaerocolumna aminovalerica]|jgi:GntR family transcriptional repressor for pyruvate dehydrogenase complex|uniref:DNA-binding transcriptional regulator, FadR family n=1 Tax=Anaerocolumna aminovalerica TaxID=1527 RepID=A0A1I5H8Z9_9FIRM|nr:FadR/GntR family transcriptional regulator [Anaerocolumna aminovalerica]MBU5334010.1 FadR family transcriptional regulator [Anaerocolumna aminovalerica]MDU6265152.1 FadR/GntR family transcriptional regulator [Anaerocolumna aminovalerica]SFO44687.1 DNA-binding transcriptional regulator, FadR family [Anaerocolumna aminovalerica]